MIPSCFPGSHDSIGKRLTKAYRDSRIAGRGKFGVPGKNLATSDCVYGLFLIAFPKSESGKKGKGKIQNRG
jgi:hypothetical protein